MVLKISKALQGLPKHNFQHSLIINTLRNLAFATHIYHFIIGGIVRTAENGLTDICEAFSFPKCDFLVTSFSKFSRSVTLASLKQAGVFLVNISLFFSYRPQTSKFRQMEILRNSDYHIFSPSCSIQNAAQDEDSTR